MGCKHTRQRAAPGRQTRHGGEQWTLRRGNSAGPQPAGPQRKRRSLPTVVRMRNTPAGQRGTWATFAKAARTGARLSQSELARRLRVDRTTVFRWETGKQKPENAELVRLFSQVLDIDLDEALAAAGLRPGPAPVEPTREYDEEIEMVRTDPGLTEAVKERIIEMIWERRERDKAAGIEETRRVIDLFRRSA